MWICIKKVNMFKAFNLETGDDLHCSFATPNPLVLTNKKCLNQARNHTFYQVISTKALPTLQIFYHEISEPLNVARCPVKHKSSQTVLIFIRNGLIKTSHTTLTF